MTKHTATPWSASATVLRNAHGHSIASGGNNGRVVGDELAASLRLAATAPKLLAALQAVARSGYLGERNPITAQVLAAIAEATGE